MTRDEAIAMLDADSVTQATNAGKIWGRYPSVIECRKTISNIFCSRLKKALGELNPMTNKELAEAISLQFNIPQASRLDRTINRAIRTLPGGSEVLDAIEAMNAARNRAEQASASYRAMPIEAAIERLESIRSALEKHIVSAAQRLSKQRALVAKSIELGTDARIAEIIADIKIRMEERGITQSDLAAACGWHQPLVSDYLNGKKTPGLENLVTLATALDCVWKLVDCG